MPRHGGHSSQLASSCSQCTSGMPRRWITGTSLVAFAFPWKAPSSTLSNLTLSLRLPAGLKVRISQGGRRMAQACQKECRVRLFPLRLSCTRCRGLQGSHQGTEGLRVAKVR